MANVYVVRTEKDVDTNRIQHAVEGRVGGQPLLPPQGPGRGPMRDRDRGNVTPPRQGKGRPTGSGSAKKGKGPAHKHRSNSDDQLTGMQDKELVKLFRQPGMEISFVILYKTLYAIFEKNEPALTKSYQSRTGGLAVNSISEVCIQSKNYSYLDC